MKKYLIFAICAIALGLTTQAEDLSDGEWGLKYDSITPNMTGQATADHLFVEKGVSFLSGDTQLVWFHLNDDEIYQNSKVQSLTPMPYTSSGKLYNEITYNSFQCDIYLPEGISIVEVEDPDGDKVGYEYGERMPISSLISWAARGTRIIDGKRYNVFSLVCFSTKSYGAHLSARNARVYEQNGALKKEHTLFGLYLHNDKQNEAQSRLPQDLIIANQIFNIFESVNAGWDANESTFFYGTGGNDETQVFMKYDRSGIYGSNGYDRNYFFLPENTATLQDKTVTLPVRLQNEDAISGFQTELILPKGFTIPKRQGQYQVSLSERKATDHTLEVEEMGNGIVKITSQSPTNAAYSGNDGELCLITLYVPAAVDSTYTLHLNNTMLTGTQGQHIYVNDATGTVTVYPYNQGDVNNDSYYTVGDVVTTTCYIMGTNPSPFYFMAADMNTDNLIDDTDLALMTEVVLEDYSELPEDYGLQTNDMLSIEDLTIAPGGAMTVQVKLNNQQEYAAFQTDISMSEGLSIRKAGQNDAFTPSDRLLEEPKLESYLHENNTVRLMAITSMLAPITAGEEPLFTFEVVADDKFAGSGTITLSRTLFSAADGTEYRLADTQCTVKKMLRGDVNGDGVVNVGDINAVVNIILGGHASPEVMKRADVNGDGMVNISDINLLISIILG